MNGDAPVRILLVDDDEDQWVLVRAIVREIYGGEASLEWASRWDAALDRVRARDHDVVLLDHHLGVRTGVELLTLARSEGVRTPIVMLTGTGSFSVDRDATRAGADDYLEKEGLSAPFLERAIRHALERCRAREELLRQQEELAERNAELMRFAEGVAHDLRQPLQTMSLLIDLARGEFEQSGGSAGIELCDDLGASARRMQGMLGDLLEYAKAGGRSAGAEPVDLDALLSDLRQDLRSSLEAAGGQIVGHDLGTIRADRAGLRQVLLNLLTNAVKYRSAAPPRIEVCLARAPTGVRLTVSDNGIGVPASDGRRIFGAFVRARGAEVVPGTGLGLAICDRLVRNMGGRIGHDPRPGGGSVFWVEIPGG